MKNRVVKICCFAFVMVYVLVCSTTAQEVRTYGVKNKLPADYELIKQRMTFPLSWHRAGQQMDFDSWRKEARACMLNTFMDTPVAVAVPFDSKIAATEQRNGYRADKVEFNISLGNRIEGYLLTPDGNGPFPAIVLFHDHSGQFHIGKEKLIRPFAVDPAVIADAEAYVKKHNTYEGVFLGDFFAQNGYVVFAIDAVGWGFRGTEDRSVQFTDYAAWEGNLNSMGLSWGGLIVWDDVRSVEFVASLPSVDPARIGVAGLSVGGHRSWSTSAATDLVSAAASVCWMSTMEELLLPNNNYAEGGFSMSLPGISRYLDKPDIASIACPKPSLFIAGELDWLFSSKGYEDAFASMRKVWESQGAGDKFHTSVYPSDHIFNRAMQREVLDFFNKYLRGQ